MVAWPEAETGFWNLLRLGDAPDLGFGPAHLTAQRRVRPPFLFPPGIGGSTRSCTLGACGKIMMVIMVVVVVSFQTSGLVDALPGARLPGQRNWWKRCSWGQRTFFFRHYGALAALYADRNSAHGTKPVAGPVSVSTRPAYIGGGIAGEFLRHVISRLFGVDFSRYMLNRFHRCGHSIRTGSGPHFRLQASEKLFHVGSARRFRLRRRHAMFGRLLVLVHQLHHPQCLGPF